ncbi:hypothetical protein FH972_013308 [Carpinus fangiana]|uniref:PGG domain-containing protein n=1 Tax=Carpinus fangiana TaxID=176857 RepID=A0A5N6R6A0_9ROSI|nr:hypothetical protein FH972_013308 [Carpinus fangiana]
MDRRHDEEENMVELYEASRNGCVSSLNTLIQRDAYIFDRVSLTSFSETPLHIAALLGHLEFSRALVSMKPELVEEVDSKGRSPLHIASALRAIPRYSKDHDGNSLLHLAVMLKQMKTIKYLLSISEIETKLNRFGDIAFDVSEAGVRRSLDPNSNSLLATSNAIGPNAALPTQSGQSDCSKFRRWWSSLVKNFKYQDNWMEETRGTLMVVATVIASMAFQAAISPPGGVWQENTTTGGFNCKQHICEAGTPALAYRWPDDYLKFLSFNTASFFASLSVVFLVVSGFPLSSQLAIWFLTLAMSTAVTFMAITYLWIVVLVIPDHLYPTAYRMNNWIKYTWIGLLVVVGVIHTIHLLSWGMNRLLSFKRRSTMGPLK